MVRLLNVYTISSFVALGGVLYGFDVASMSGIVGTHQYKAYYGNPLGATQGCITGAIAAGSLVGALCSAVAIQLGTIAWCVGASLQAASNGVALLIMGRIVAGFCIGVTSALIHIYQSEIAPRKIRGRIVSLQHFAICLGILIQYFVQYGCSFLDSQAVFRLPWALQTIPAILLFIGLFWLPRSPRWVASKDRWDEVLHVIAFLRTPDCNISDPLVLAEFKEIEEQIRIEREEHSNSYCELFGKKMRKRVLLGMAAQGWSQLTEVNMLLYFIVYFLNSAGISNALLASSFQYIVFIVATIPTILWTDQWGRRTSLLIGSLCVAFFMFVMAGLFVHFGQLNPVPDQPYTWIIVDHPAASRGVQASVYLASTSFAMSWGPIEWIYPRKTQAFIHVWFVLPETKQRTLEEMDEIFEHGDPAWRSFTGLRYKTSHLDTLAREIEQDKLDMHRPRLSARRCRIERS
ncbi:general substrate transporter [Lipomyces tetrasporus]